MSKNQLLLVFLLAWCLAAPSVPQEAWGQKLSVSEIERVEINDSDFAEMVSDPYEVIEIDGVPGMPDAKLIVKSDRKGVLYLSDEGEVLRALWLDRHQLIGASADGAVVGVLDAKGIDDGTLGRLRVETATGDLLWERDDGLGVGEKGYAPFYVTPQGYVVVSSNIHPLGFASGNITHPLIFDSKGQLIAELPARYIWNNIAISRDGLYLALSFCDLDAECDGTAV